MAAIWNNDISSSFSSLPLFVVVVCLHNGQLEHFTSVCLLGLSKRDSIQISFENERKCVTNEVRLCQFLQRMIWQTKYTSTQITSCDHLNSDISLICYPLNMFHLMTLQLTASTNK